MTDIPQPSPFFRGLLFALPLGLAAWGVVAGVVFGAIAITH